MAELTLSKGVPLGVRVPPKSQQKWEYGVMDSMRDSKPRDQGSTPCTPANLNLFT